MKRVADRTLSVAGTVGIVTVGVALVSMVLLFILILLGFYQPWAR